MRRSWFRIFPPLSAFHSQTLASKAARPKSSLRLPARASCRSTTS
jgi:hypothetical protein